ncbi:MAG: helix-turn-helix domain-containing protein [Porticoccaceae bacterium]|nr:hypothetical protein [Porticoccaceae bacterium]MEA3299475.1 hypothetical protein [Pseudomonadota bacterium]HLS99792.1 helix-turn-helix domain-containing protein [Porticoccaceae bacterium]
MASSGKKRGDKHDDGTRPGALDALLRGLQDITTQTWSKAAGQYPGNLLDLLMRTPDHMVQMGKAGRYLKDLREVAGLTVDDLASNLQLENPDILRAIEEGRSPVTLDILHRLASFHARNDPVGFMMNYSREYAPLLWQLLRLTGMDRLLIGVEREIKFINLYRARDRARALDDGDFDRVLDFLGKAFDLALDFNGPPAAPRKPPNARAKPVAAKSSSGKSSARK